MGQPLDPNKKLTQYTIDYWGDNQGLVSGGVLSILQSKEGYIWLGTFNGVSRFDGVNFVNYNKVNTPAITNNGVLAIYEDNEGSIWAGTNGGGVVVISKDSTYSITTNQGLADNSIHTFYGDKNGDIYMGTKRGMSVYHNGIITNYNNFYSSGDTINNISVRSIRRDFNGQLWVVTSNGLYQLTGNILTRYRLEDEKYGDFEILSIVESPEGELIIGTYGEGAYKLDVNGEFIKMYLPDIISKINYLYYDSNDALWICHQNGVMRYYNGEFSNLSTQEGLSEDAVEEVIEDREGSIWITTYYGGINRLRDGIFKNFTTYEGLTNNTVHSMFENDNGDVWICTTDGVNRLNKNGTIDHFKKEKGYMPGNLSRDIFIDSKKRIWIATYDGLALIENGQSKFFTTAEGLSNNQVRIVYEDSKNNIWIGTRSGLNIYKNGTFKQVTVKEGLLNDFILSIHESKNGDIWIGTSGGGLAKYSGGNIEFYTSNDGLPSDIVFRIHENADGMWIATNNGLCYYDGKHFFYGFDSKDGFLNSSIFQIIEDDYGYFWLTCDFGIVKVSKEEVLKYLKSGEKGIINEISYKQVDGLKRSECTGAGKSIKTKDGRIWFATLGGVAIVDPSDSITNLVPPSVVIEEFKADQRVINIPDGGIHLDPYTKNIEIKYTGLSLKVPQRVQFKYQLIGHDDDWVDPGNRRTAYYSNLAPGKYTFKVLACNNDRIWSKEPQVISFYLEPGFYQTKWFYLVVVIGVVIMFYAFYQWRTRSIKREKVLLENVVEERTSEISTQKEEISSQRDNIEEKNRRLEEAQQIIQEQNLKLKSTNKDLEEIVQQRTKELQKANEDLLVAISELDHFLYRSSHDLKGPITRLLGLCHLGKIEIDQGNTIEYLEKLEYTAQEMEIMLSRLIRVSELKSHQVKPASINLQAFFQRIVHNIVPEDQNFRVDFNLETQTFISDLFLLNIVFENLIKNAVEFQDTEKKEYRILISSRVKNNKMYLSVANSGLEIPKNIKPKLFDMFFRGTDEGKGAGLGLYVAKFIVVNKLQGQIELNDNNKELIEFEVRLPNG